MRTDRRLLTAVLFATLAFPRAASAFCRTTTAQVPADYDPTVSGCLDQGHPLYWKNACVGYDLQKDASKQLSYDQAATGIAEAFTRWTSTACPTDGTGPSRVSIDVRDLGPVDCDIVEYDQYGPNQNAIIFRDTIWPHDDSENTLALTTVTYDPDTGEIFDADMEINGADQTLTAWDPMNPNAPLPDQGYDFLSIVTHETGHFLGMAHSVDTRATMFAHYTPGSTAMRMLTGDDVAGICSIYSPDGTRNTDPTAAPPNGQVAEGACDPTPRQGLTTSCCPDYSGGKCQAPPVVSCTVGRAPGRQESGGAAGLAIAVVAVVLGRRRRHRYGR